MGTSALTTRVSPRPHPNTMDPPDEPRQTYARRIARAIRRPGGATHCSTPLMKSTGRRSSAKSPKSAKKRKAKSASKIPRPRTHLTPSDVDSIVQLLEQGRRRINRRKRDKLLRDLNDALARYTFRASQAAAPTPTKFWKRFDALCAALKRLQANLPANRHDELFKYLVRLGERYAAQHGPHPGIAPKPLPVVRLPNVDEGKDFGSARRLRELTEAVAQVARWMKHFDEFTAPNQWARLEKIYGGTRSPRVWLTGKALPSIFEKHFGRIKGASSRDRVSGKRTYAPWVHFVLAVADAARIRSTTGSLSLATIVSDRERMAKAEPFEMVDPLGPEWTRNLD
jgi:hypothetical protein